MTYRIDQVKKSSTPGYAWRFEIKGFEGRGEYVTLYTDQDGHGLHAFKETSIELIPGTEAFEVAKEAAEDEAHRALAIFLDLLGWGPMVDDQGNVIESFKADVSTCPKCGAAMLHGKAIEQTWEPGVFGALEPGLATMHPGGKGRLIDCIKCPKCGYSVR